VILLDTTPLVALCDWRDALHETALRDLDRVARRSMILCAPVLTEACFLLRYGAQRERLRRVIEAFARGNDRGVCGRTIASSARLGAGPTAHESPSPYARRTPRRGRAPEVSVLASLPRTDGRRCPSRRQADRYAAAKYISSIACVSRAGRNSPIERDSPVPPCQTAWATPRGMTMPSPASSTCSTPARRQWSVPEVTSTRSSWSVCRWSSGGGVAVRATYSNRNSSPARSSAATSTVVGLPSPGARELLLGHRAYLRFSGWRRSAKDAIRFTWANQTRTRV